MRVPLPIQEAIRDLTSDLFGRGTAVDKTQDSVKDPEDVGAVVSYRDDDGKVRVVAVVEQALVGILGAALVMLPAPALEEATRRGVLPENIYENFWEVANIMTSLLNKPNGPHLVLADKYTSLDDAGDELRTVIDSRSKQRDFSVTIVGYGTGRVSLFAA